MTIRKSLQEQAYTLENFPYKSDVWHFEDFAMDLQSQGGIAGLDFNISKDFDLQYIDAKTLTLGLVQREHALFI